MTPFKIHEPDEGHIGADIGKIAHRQKERRQHSESRKKDDIEA
jgi:hypothetical protein